VPLKLPYECKDSQAFIDICCPHARAVEVVDLCSIRFPRLLRESGVLWFHCGMVSYMPNYAESEDICLIESGRRWQMVYFVQLSEISVLMPREALTDEMPGRMVVPMHRNVSKCDPCRLLYCRHKTAHPRIDGERGKSPSIHCIAKGPKRIRARRL